MDFECIAIPLFSQIMHLVLEKRHYSEFPEAVRCWMLVCKFWRQFAFEHLTLLKTYGLNTGRASFLTCFKNLQRFDVNTVDYDLGNPYQTLIIPPSIINLKVLLTEPYEQWFGTNFESFASQLKILKVRQHTYYPACNLAWMKTFDMSKLTKLQQLDFPDIVMNPRFLPPNLQILSMLGRSSPNNISESSFALHNLTKLTRLHVAFERLGDAGLLAQRLPSMSTLKKLSIEIRSLSCLPTLDPYLLTSLECLSITRLSVCFSSLVSKDIYPNLTRLILKDVKSFGEVTWEKFPRYFPNLKHLMVLVTKYIRTKDKIPIPLAQFSKNMNLESLEIDDYFGEDLRPIKHVILRMTRLHAYNNFNALYFLKGIPKITIRCIFDDPELARQCFFPIIALFNFIRPSQGLIFLDHFESSSFHIDEKGKITHEHKFDKLY